MPDLFEIHDFHQYNTTDVTFTQLIGHYNPLVRMSIYFPMYCMLIWSRRSLVGSVFSY